MEDRVSLLRRVVRYELPLEDTLVLLRAYGWDSDEELVILTARDVVRLLDRFLAGELSTKQVEHWAELLEMRKDIGFESRWAAHLRQAIAQLADSESHEALTPGLAVRMRRTFAGEVPE